MSLPLLLSLVVAWLVGVGVLRAVWPDAVAARPYRSTVAALGVGVGLGVTSLGLFAWLLLVGTLGRGVILVELASLALLWLWVRRREGRRPPQTPEQPTWAPDPVELRWVTVLFVATACCAVAAFTGISLTRPHGAWDAWMNWNLRARLLFRSGPEWRVAFSPLIPWSHPDYPLLVQASVVRTWVYAGREAMAGSALIAFAFTFGTVALASAAIGALRGRTQGMLTGLVLLATPFFIFHGTSQYGDVPVGFFLLSTIVLFTLHEQHRDRTCAFLGLAGLTAGLAAWTKNEGLLFLVAFAAGWALSGAGTRQRRDLAREAGHFALGLLAPALMLALFKLWLAPPNDLVTAAGAGRTLSWLGDPHRYWTVARGFIAQIAAFGFNGWISGVGLLVLFGLCVGVRPAGVRGRWLIATLSTLGLALAGHAVVFLTAVDDVPRMLGSALERLLLQLWPATVFSVFMILATPGEAAQREAAVRPAAGG